MGGARGGQVWEAAASMPLPSICSPRKNIDGDEVHLGNQAHAKVWHIKRHFCKTAQISVIYFAFANITKNLS